MSRMYFNSSELCSKCLYVFKCYTDLDECVVGLDNCDGNAACTNTDGSFTCTCRAGFDGDGTTCSGGMHDCVK